MVKLTWNEKPWFLRLAAITLVIVLFALLFLDIFSQGRIFENPIMSTVDFLLICSMLGFTIASLFFHTKNPKSQTLKN